MTLSAPRCAALLFMSADAEYDIPTHRGHLRGDADWWMLHEGLSVVVDTDYRRLTPAGLSAARQAREQKGEG